MLFGNGKTKVLEGTYSLFVARGAVVVLSETTIMVEIGKPHEGMDNDAIEVLNRNVLIDVADYVIFYYHSVLSLL